MSEKLTEAPTDGLGRPFLEPLQAARVKLWCDVAVAVAGALNATSTTAPGKWADEALESFDETFGTEKPGRIEDGTDQDD